MNITANMRIPSWLPALGLVAIAFAGVALIRAPQSTSAASPSFNALVHWRDRGHDWLVVADGPADQLVVYNAVDGHPLRRLKVAHGLQDVDALVQRDGQLFVVDDDGELDELRLPQLQVASASHP
ncbi:hypothetical protein ACFPPA_04895 [Rhodanobacter ginsengisoli]|uniref:Uncharacterized protein n=1 Tax=Rhodanobacter ginsengisoli TaxID=418646 RepID=A0ABW0QJX9_9GAMM